MKILIDAQCFLWWFVEPDRLSAETIAAISDETNSIWFSHSSPSEWNTIDPNLDWLGHSNVSGDIEIDTRK
ncbi:hypothetical protein [Chamaesiphon sp.]|uniref:hypothetical protein n=1 Tax=Chamaesiphon sp. TaxID=2814140 RepID=UPI0035931C1B